jgi:four helix bundle protein
MRDYKKIHAWELADDLTVEAYRLSKSFPREERYGLTGQLRRAVSSVPANIAEGAARGTKRDYLHFLYIARASLSETDYLIHLAKRLEYLDQDVHRELATQVRRTFGCLHALIVVVERETGMLAKISAGVTSLAVLSLARLLTAFTP